MEQRLLEYIVNSLWQLPLLAGGAWLLLRILQPEPHVQHRLWLAVLGLAVILPAHGAWKIRSAGLSVALKAEKPAQIINAQPRSLPLEHDQVFSWRFHTWNVRLPAPAAKCVVALYLAAILFALARFARGWRAARRFIRHSRETLLPPQAAALLEDCCRRSTMQPPGVRVSDSLLSPVVIGAVKPILLLPKSFSEHTEEEMEAALRHELAHIRRRDYLMNLACQIYALPVAWHPAIYGVQQRIRRTREMVCDAMAARETHSEIRYATCLMTLSRDMLRRRYTAEDAHALGLFDKDILEERIMRLMGNKPETSTKAKLARMGSGAAVAITGLAVLAVFHITPVMARSRDSAVSEAAQNISVSSQAAAPSQSMPAASPPAHEPGAQKQGSSSPQPAKTDGKPTVTHKAQRGVASEEHCRIDDEMAQAERQIAKTQAWLESPAFKQQMLDAQKQAEEAKSILDSPEFKQQMENAQDRFQQQIREALEQAEKSKPILDDPKFKQQMELANKRMAEAVAKLNSPEFQRQMREAQEQAEKTRAQLNSPEFQQRMAKQMEAARKQMDEMIRHKMDDLQNQPQAIPQSR